MSRAVVYIPSGDMCINCVHALDSCNHLDFDEMRVIDNDSSDPGVEYRVVRCSGYRRSMNPVQEKPYKPGKEVR